MAKSDEIMRRLTDFLHVVDANTGVTKKPFNQEELDFAFPLEFDKLDISDLIAQRDFMLEGIKKFRAQPTIMMSDKEINEALAEPRKYLEMINQTIAQITGKKHIPFYKKVQKYYTLNIDKINTLGKQIKAGTDQTIINYLVQQNNIDVTYMSEAYNLQDLFRKNLLHIPKHSWFPDELRFLEAGWVYHFNAIPQNDRHVSYWMERTYNELYK